MRIFNLYSNLFQYEKIKKVDNEMQMKANEKKTERESEIKNTSPEGDFANILQTAFSYKSFIGSFNALIVCICIFW